VLRRTKSVHLPLNANNQPRSEIIGAGITKGEEMIKYIAVEKDTPDVPRAWGEGKTDLVARYQCEIALREKLLGKIERGCQEGFAQTHLYIIKRED